MQLYCGQLVNFQLYQCFLDGAPRGDGHAPLVTIILVPNISNIVARCVTWVIGRFYLLIIHSEEIKDHLTVKRSIKLHLLHYQVHKFLKSFVNSIMYLERTKRKENERMMVHGKKSILFELPYWATNKLRHNLDVMHIEKNICDSVLGTLLDILGKSKDHINYRYDLYEMWICKDLQPLKDCDT